MTLCVDDLVLIEIAGVNFLLSKLTNHGEEERKIHDLALENLQKFKRRKMNGIYAGPRK